MHARWLYLVVALVFVVVVAAFWYLPDELEPEATPEPELAPVVATLPVTVTPAVAPATTSDAATRDINLALVIDGDASRFQKIPEDPEARLRELAAAVEAGVPDAADELFLLAYRCGPDAAIPVPSTEAAYTKAREHLVQTRTFTTPGPIVPDLDSALGFLDAGYRLCSAFERLGLPAQAHWNRVAAELGSHFARVAYWDVQRGTDNWEAVQSRGIEYLERARDDGYVPAFFNIGMMHGGQISDGPYSANPMEGLAHLYASLDLRVAIIAGREDSGYYAENSFLRRADSSLESMNAQFVRQLEMQVSPYQIQAARERADELLDRCCR